MKKAFLVSLMLFVSLYSRGQIKIEYDEFENETTYRTPFHKGFGIAFPEPVVGTIVKKDSGQKRAYLSATTFCQTIGSADARGLYILFEDGSKLDFTQAEVDFDYNSSLQQFTADAFVALEDEELKEIAEKRIKAIRLYVYERYLTKKETTRINQNLNLLLNQP
jgi:hypothetical protein